MARTNCDPYAGAHLFALVNRVTGLLDSEAEVTATVRALEEDALAARGLAGSAGRPPGKLRLLGRRLSLRRRESHPSLQEQETHGY